MGVGEGLLWEMVGREWDKCERKGVNEMILKGKGEGGIGGERERGRERSVILEEKVYKSRTREGQG